MLASTLSEHMKFVSDRAETLQERMGRCSSRRGIQRTIAASEAGCVELSGTGDDLAQAWQAILKGDESDDRLARRLNWSGWKSDDLQGSALEDPQVLPGDLPKWARELLRCSTAISRVSHGARSSRRENSVDKPPRSFVELVDALTDSFVRQTGAKDVNGDACLTRPVFSKAAAADMDDWLSRRLTNLMEQCLFEMFAARRPMLQNLQLRFAAVQQPQTFDLYNAFVADQLETGLSDVFATYPVLARMVGTTLLQWQDAKFVFAQRLEEDWNDLADFVGFDATTTTVARVKCGLSDPHNGGRSVFILTLSTGAKAVYKPRDLGIDDSLGELAELLTHDLPVNIRIPRVLCRVGYGWMEFIEDERETASPASDEFWRNAGALLCLFHIVGGADAHFQNVFVTKRCPVLIDSEAVFSRSHAVGAERPDETELTSLRANDRLIFNSSLLTSWYQYGQDENHVIDAGGIGALFPEPAQSDIEVDNGSSIWRHINSDQMVCETSTSPNSVCDQSNGEDEKKVASNFGISDGIISSISDGFSKVFERAIVMRSDVHKKLTSFADLHSRVIHQQTGAYHLLLMRALTPENLRCGIAFGLALEKLNARPAAHAERPDDWPLFEAAIVQLSALDTPYFASRIAGRSIDQSVGHRETLVATWESGLDAAHDRLDGFSQRTLASYQAGIRAALEARRSSDNGRPKARSPWSPNAKPIDKSGVVDLRQHAHRIGQEIRSRVIEHHGRLTWFTPSKTVGQHRLQAKVLDFGLYAGSMGVAVFLAALDRDAGRDEYENLWVNALTPVCDWEGPKRPRVVGLGIGTGFGSYMMGFSALLSLSNSRQHAWINSSAQQLIARLTPELIAEDSKLDLVSGAAGALVGLVEYYRTSQHRPALDAAVLCAEHIMARYAPARDGRAATSGWCGLSHGAAGVALALGRLWRETQDEKLVNAITNLIDFEDQHYLPEVQNWRDLRSENGSECARGVMGHPALRSRVVSFSSLAWVSQTTASKAIGIMRLKASIHLVVSIWITPAVAEPVYLRRSCDLANSSKIPKWSILRDFDSVNSQNPRADRSTSVSTAGIIQMYSTPHFFAASRVWAMDIFVPPRQAGFPQYLGAKRVFNKSTRFPEHDLDEKSEIVLRHAEK